MGSTFAGLALFDSGPHRFIVGSMGRYVRGPFQTPAELEHSVNEAKLELKILQTGRLIASSTSALWTLMDAIQVRAEASTLGTLVDHHGRSWAGMTMIGFRPDRKIDRGRVVSAAYRVEYLKFGP